MTNPKWYKEKFSDGMIYFYVGLAVVALIVAYFKS